MAPASAASPPRRVACLVLPRWPLQVAARTRPGLLARPAAVVAAGRVLAASAPAAAAGVRPDLVEAEALARCPGLLVVAGDAEAAAALEGELLRRFDAISPVVEPHRPGVWFLDWGGLRGAAEEVGLAAHLTARLRADLGLDARVGIADGPFVAAVAARAEATPDGPARVAPGRGAAFLAPRPLLLPSGTDARLRRRLAALGVRTFGELARLPEADLVARLGPAAAHVHRLARGDDARPLRPRAAPIARAVTVAFDEPEADLDRLTFAALRALTPLLGGLAAEGLAADAVRIDLRLADGGRVVAEAALAGAGADRVVADRLRAAMQRPGIPLLAAPVTALALTLTGIGRATGRQLALAEAGRAAGHAGRLRAAARLWARFGERGALRLAVRPALLPEAAVVVRPWDDAPAAGPPPDPDAVAAALPGLNGLRWAAPPRPVRVLLEGGRPTSLQDGGRRMRLAAALGPSRAVAGWWGDGALAVDRDYWLVADPEGNLLVLVDDRAAGGWAIVGEVA